ncbi:MAG: PH domain-containing protein [Bacilli bacterium]|nr:PH domain-containing protein [Bacilli bacterium]
MSKYESVSNIVVSTSLDNIIVKGEEIVWRGKPKKSAFIINKILMMLPIALIWLMIDSSFIMVALSSFDFKEIIWFIIPFFALHLMPVWIWLGNVLTANKKWKNTEYAVTNKRIIIMSGFIGMDYQSIYYKDIKNVDLKINVIDKVLKVGDIYFDTNQKVSPGFLDIENVYEIYPKIQKVVLDIQTDIEYPNNLRPKENDGYNTKYNVKI